MLLCLMSRVLESPLSEPRAGREGDRPPAGQVLPQEVGQGAQRRGGDVLQCWAGEGRLCGAFHLTEAVKHARSRCVVKDAAFPQGAYITQENQVTLHYF